nr:MAG TPA: hypothetical protein [Crassvirales sp.]
MEKCQISPITFREELIRAIGLTSGMAGVREYETTSLSDFLKWYKFNVSFCSKHGQLIVQQVIAFFTS